MTVPAINYPGALDLDSTLFLAANNIGSTLSADITAVQTTIGLVDASIFPASGFISIKDVEIVHYTSIATNTLQGCTRGADGTSAASASAADAVDLNITAIMHNRLKDVIKAIEAELGTDPAGSEATVKARLAAIEAEVATSYVRGAIVLPFYLTTTGSSVSIIAHIPHTIAAGKIVIESVDLVLDAAIGVGKTITVDVNKAGSTIFTTQGLRPSITGATYQSLGNVPDVVTVTADSDFTADVDILTSAFSATQGVITINVKQYLT